MHEAGYTEELRGDKLKNRDPTVLKLVEEETKEGRKKRRKEEERSKKKSKEHERVRVYSETCR